jgi:hypothetical protein
VSTPAAVVWTAHAAMRLRQRFGLEVAQMARHAHEIESGAKFFGAAASTIRVGKIHMKCRWCERKQAAVVLTVHGGKILRVPRAGSKQVAKRARGKLAARRDRWDGEE